MDNVSRGSRLFPSLLLPTLLAAGVAHADALKIEIGAYNWQPDYDGYVQSGADRVDLNDDLGFDDDTAAVLYAVLEHPLPLLPNVKLQHTRIDTDARGTTTRSFEFDGVPFQASVPVQSKLELTHTDATLYYQLLDNVVDLDLGLTVRYLDGSASITGAGQSASEQIEVTLPLLYAAAQASLPLGFYLGADINGLAVSSDKLLDYRLRAGWVSPLLLGVEVGMRRFDIDYDDDNDKADLSLDGVYGAITFQF
jgi:outer membrane protein